MSSNQETIVFTVNDIVKNYAAKDFVPAKAEPRSDVFFEMKVGEASLGLAKKGYLQISLKCNALDGSGGTMFTKYMNLALPVSYKGVSPHASAASILQDALKALNPELAVFDEVQEDAATGKKVYLKNGTPVTGKAYDAAVKAQADGIAAIIDGLVDPATATATIESFNGRTFFARIVPSADGQYTNLKSLLGRKPSKDPVAYDRATAFGK
jgi:hypothetical protein